jgi:hypothetical protein
MANTDLLTDKPSIFSTIRVQAITILQGPRGIESSEGEDKFYGWPILSLERSISAPTDYIELRSVYANPYDTTQQIAILRAVSWNGESVRKLVRKQGHEFKLVIPVRFIKLPIEELKSWLSEFDGTRLTINIDYPGNIANIKKLRIEQDYTSCIFEKVWQVQPVSRSKLDQSWNRVWIQMTEKLIGEPPVNDLDEDFWFKNADVMYDFQGYQPDWFNFS